MFASYLSNVEDSPFQRNPQYSSSTKPSWSLSSPSPGTCSLTVFCCKKKHALHLPNPFMEFFLRRQEEKHNLVHKKKPSNYPQKLQNKNKIKLKQQHPSFKRNVLYLACTIFSILSIFCYLLDLAEGFDSQRRWKEYIPKKISLSELYSFKGDTHYFCRK